MKIDDMNVCELSLEDKQTTEGGSLLLIALGIGLLWGIGDALF